METEAREKFDDSPAMLRSASPQLHYDGLRGLACLFVLFAHLRYHGFYLHETIALGRYAQFGLFIFFFLSAFLITKSAITNPELLHPKTWLAYFARRFFRIWPLFAAVVLLDLVFFHYYFGSLGPVSPDIVLQHLTFRIGRGPLWTMPVEVSFYVLLVPWMIVLGGALLTGPKWSGGVTLGLFLSSLAWLLYVALVDRTGVVATWGVHQYAPYFVVGSATAAVAVRFRSMLRSLPDRVGSTIGLGALTITLLQNPLWWQAVWPYENWRYDPSNIEGLTFAAFLSWRIYAFVPVMAVLFICLESEAVTLRSLLAWRPLSALGKISFGVYLLHMPMVYFVREHVTTDHLQGFLLVISMTCVLSFLLNRGLERPGMRLGERLIAALRLRKLPHLADTR